MSLVGGVSLHYYQPLLLTIAIIGSILAGAISLVQSDMKRLVAYLSIGHMALIQAILPTLAIKEILLISISHALGAGLLFYLIGCIYERYHARSMHVFQGMATTMPIISFTFLIAAITSNSLPGTIGYIGELAGIKVLWSISPISAMMVIIGVCIMAIATMVMISRTTLGIATIYRTFDANRLEISLIASTSTAIFLLHWLPSLVL